MTPAEFKKAFGNRMRVRRLALDIRTLEDLATCTGINVETLSRYETGRVYPDQKNLRKICDALECELSELTGVERWPRWKRNPKPVAIGELSLESQYLMIGNHTEPMEIEVRYSREPLTLPRVIRPLRERLLDVARARARDQGFPLFDGPAVRLVRAYGKLTDYPTARLRRVTQENTRQDRSGKEQTGLVLELAPVSWFDFVVLNTFLDDVDVLPDEPQRTLRQMFADEQWLFRNGTDLSWCQLSNVLTINMTPITSDGYGLIVHRNPRGVSNASGRYANGVCENFHRYLDAAPPDNPRRRLNDLRPASSQPVIATNSRNDVPSPLLVAERGLWEEISEELYWRIAGEYERYHFLNITVDGEYFNPHLVGVIELGLERREVDRLIRTSPGKDQTEGLGFDFLSLDSQNAATAELINKQHRWVPIGLAATISAIHYWEARTRKRSGLLSSRGGR